MLSVMRSIVRAGLSVRRSTERAIQRLSECVILLVVDRAMYLGRGVKAGV
jgi:hypothetical protein